MTRTVKSILVGCVVGATLAIIWFVFFTQSAATNPSRSSGFLKDRINDSIAQPTLKPEDVVQLQLSSLQKSKTDPDAIVDCYSLATPSNRELTGPLSRFNGLVRSDAYRALIGHRKAIVGRPIPIETLEPEARDASTLLVTVIDDSGVAQSFQFVLERQTEPPYQGCWMTESVFPIEINADNSRTSADRQTSVPTEDANGVGAVSAGAAGDGDD